ncbi:Gag-polypeptide of LTR copia-type [Sesbania bispinosa]|nr:Gag-polypeptide of LTR copia-type [Sesbania bispinosa]
MADQAKDPSQDPTNPLFLHHSDGPGLVLTSQPLDHKNYTTWSRAMQVALSVKNKLPIIDGTLPKPAATDATSAAWTRANNHLQSHTESEYVMSFLMGLNDSFSQIRGQILLSDPLPSIGNVFSLVLQEEAQLEIVATHSSSTGNSENIAFSVNSSQKYQSDSSKNKFLKNEGPKCSHCAMLGHTKDKCYKLVGYPPKYFKNRPTNTVNHVDDSSESSNTPQTSTLSPAQCQQLISFLTNQMNTDSPCDAVATNVTGPQDIEDDWNC